MQLIILPMKIKESKYYHPVNILQLDSDDHIDVYDKYRLLTFSNPFRSLLQIRFALYLTI